MPLKYEDFLPFFKSIFNPTFYENNKITCDEIVFWDGSYAGNNVTLFINGAEIVTREIPKKNKRINYSCGGRSVRKMAEYTKVLLLPGGDVPDVRIPVAILATDISMASGFNFGATTRGPKTRSIIDDLELNASFPVDNKTELYPQNVKINVNMVAFQYGIYQGLFDPIKSSQLGIMTLTEYEEAIKNIPTDDDNSRSISSSRDISNISKSKSRDGGDSLLIIKEVIRIKLDIYGFNITGYNDPEKSIIGQSKNCTMRGYFENGRTRMSYTGDFTGYIFGTPYSGEAVFVDDGSLKSISTILYDPITVNGLTYSPPVTFTGNVIDNKNVSAWGITSNGKMTTTHLVDTNVTILKTDGTQFYWQNNIIEGTEIKFTDPPTAQTFSRFYGNSTCYIDNASIVPQIVDSMAQMEVTGIINFGYNFYTSIPHTLTSFNNISFSDPDYLRFPNVIDFTTDYNTLTAVNSGSTYLQINGVFFFAGTIRVEGNPIINYKIRYGVPESFTFEFNQPQTLIISGANGSKFYNVTSIKIDAPVYYDYYIKSWITIYGGTCKLYDDKSPPNSIITTPSNITNQSYMMPNAQIYGGSIYTPSWVTVTNYNSSPTQVIYNGQNVATLGKSQYQQVPFTMIT